MPRLTLAGRWTAYALLAAAGLGAGYWLAPRDPAAPVQAAAGALIPERRPDFTLTDLEGVPRSISEWDGRPLMINFWATWCPPCRREIPLLNALRAEYLEQGFEVVGVAVDFRDDVLDYLQRTEVNYPVLIGEEDGMEAARSFGMPGLGFPFTVFTDSRGRIVTLHVGELHREQAEVILGAVQDLEAGRKDLAAAQQWIRDRKPSAAKATS